MKKVISLILAVVLVLSCTVTAFAADESREFFFELTVDGGCEKKVQPGDIVAVVFTHRRMDSEEVQLLHHAPTYADGMVFVGLSNGCVQAFNASTLESLWLYTDPLGGQPNCPLTVKDGYLYTGFWNSETGDANFVCMTITDEDPGSNGEAKCVSWSNTSKGGYYWAGAYVGDGYVLIGTDDGTNLCNSKSSSLLLMDAKTGKLLDRLDNLNGDIRSTIVYDCATDSFCFTSKGGTFYSVQVSASRLTNLWSVAQQNGSGGIHMSTCSPVAYNGRAYVGVSGSAQFGAYSGHNISVVDLGARAVAYRVDTQGYPQTSGLLTTAYEEESGYVYVYFFDNMIPGKLRVLRDRPGMTAPDYTITEKYGDVAYALFTPTGDQAQYAICSPIVDGKLGDVNSDGTIDDADARMILDYEAGLLAEELILPLADVSGDGVIDSNDAVLIRQYIAGKFDKFPAAQ